MNNYVFQLNCQLKTISEFNTFICKKTPANFLGAKKINAKGIIVSEMNKIMFEKYDELTCCHIPFPVSM